MVEQFVGQAKDQEFKDWLAQHPHSFYLNQRGQSEVMLHKVGCFHLGTGEGYNSTANFKAGSDNRAELIEWAKAQDLKVVPCSSCKPD